MTLGFAEAGQVFLSPFLQVVFEKLYSPGVNLLFKLVKGGSLQPNIIKQWDRKLRMIEGLLSDAEQKQSHNNAIKLWLEDLQDLAYDLEDILDDFATQAMLYKLNKVKNDDDDGLLGFADSMVQTIFASGSRAANSLYTLFRSNNPDMQSKIDDINDRLQDIHSQVPTLGLLAVPILQHQTHQTEGLMRWRETTSLVSEPVVYGRDDRKREIIGWLIKDKPTYENYVVIPVVGQGGIGKTTLAQYVYNDMQVEDYFEIKAWVCVSELFDVNKITTTIIHCATTKPDIYNDLNQAQVKLKKVLTGKRFLIVLDDVWSDQYDDWYQLQAPFRQGAKGSRVIVTTRIEKIARMMIKNPSHSTIITLGGLSDDDCWLLFQQHANEDSDLAEMQKDIIRKCKGLPLAAKALGGLLKSTVEKSQRQKILKSNIWSEQSSVLPVLRLSYHHLPPHLKRVFSYCSIIPKDHCLRERDIVLMWMAEGFLPDSKQERVEDIGHDYFQDLVSRSLIQPITQTRGLVTRQYFTIHDLIHDLAQWAAGNTCCIIGTPEMRTFHSRTRHLSFNDEVIDEKLRSPPMALEGGGKLRTFAYYSYDKINSGFIRTLFLDLIPIFRCLRVLSLAFMRCEVLLSCIGDLKHLRFLDLSSTCIKELPESTRNLCNLQTLLLKNCIRLTMLPTNIIFLINLRHLNIGGTALQEMPLGIGKLTNLQELDQFVLAARHGSMIRELKSLRNLHDQLNIYGLENVTSSEDAQEAKIHEKTHLNVLHMEWGTCMVEVDDNTKRNVLEQMRPHTSIQECKLEGYKGLTFPAWLGDPSFTKMVLIDLVDCEKCECLLSLGKLTSLKELRVDGLHGIKQLGLDFYGCSGFLNPFPALRILQFKRMNSWVKWLHPSADNNRAFPCLEVLYIKHCPLLQGHLPLHLPSLRILEIFECSQFSISLPSLPSLQYLMIRDCKALSSSIPVIFCSKKLSLCNISELAILPRHCPYLEALVIVNCHFVITLDQIPLTLRQLSIASCQELQYLKFEESSPCFSFIEKFSITNCVSLVSICQIPLTLRWLKVERCLKIKSIEFEVSSSYCLEELFISTCQSLVNIDRTPVTLRRLEISNCEELQCVEFEESSSDIILQEAVNSGRIDCLEVSENRLGFFPRSPRALTCLTQLKISGCASLISLPGLLLPQLAKLMLSKCENLEALPDQMHKMSSLEYLSITALPKIRCFPEGGLPRNLKQLRVHKVNLEQPIQEWTLHLSCLQVLRLSQINIQQPIQEWRLHLFTSLHDLGLSYIGYLSDSLECIPGEDFSLPSSLCELTIWGFNNLKSIACCSLPSLTKLDVGYCPNLESLGENGLPPELKDVQIYQCPLMEQQCKRDHLGRLLLQGV